MSTTAPTARHAAGAPFLNTRSSRNALALAALAGWALAAVLALVASHMARTRPGDVAAERDLWKDRAYKLWKLNDATSWGDAALLEMERHPHKTRNEIRTALLRYHPEFRPANWEYVDGLDEGRINFMRRPCPP